MSATEAETWLYEYDGPPGDEAILNAFRAGQAAANKPLTVPLAEPFSWPDREPLVGIYNHGRALFRQFDDGGFEDPKAREHEAGLLEVANHAAELSKAGA